MVSSLANAPSGLTFGKLLRGDKVEKKVERSRLLYTHTKKKVEMVFETHENHARIILKVTRLNFYGRKAYTLMKSGAIPNLMSKKIVERLYVKPEEATRTITVGTGDKSPVVKMLTAVRVAFADMVVDLELLVVDGFTLDVVIGDPKMEHLPGIIEIEKRTVRFSSEIHTVELSLDPD